MISGGSSTSSARDKDTSVYQPYTSTRSTAQDYKGDSQSNYRDDQTELERDSRGIQERVMKERAEREAEDDEGYNGKKLYRGQAAYRSYTDKNEAEAFSKNKVTGTQGPIRAPAFLRATARFDYQPNVCKDYKETGTCGYGDSCVFMHDRGDYKSGWQMEQEWEKSQAEKKKHLELASFAAGGGGGESGGTIGEGNTGEKQNCVEGEGEELPFACFICRGPFQNPVVTMCNHYFCGKCIMSLASGGGGSESSKCPVCQKQTFGVFNVATRLAKKLATTRREEESDKSGHTITTSKQRQRGGWTTIE